MNTVALVFMLISELVIASLTIYFFMRVLRSKKKPETEE